MTVEGRREENGVPLLNALPSADISTGIAIAWGICAALYARERTGSAASTSAPRSWPARCRSRTAASCRSRPSTRSTARTRSRRSTTCGSRARSYKEQLDVIAGVRPAFGNIYYRCYQTADGFIAVGCLSTPLRVKLLDAIGMQDWRVGKRPDEIDYTKPEVIAFCKALVAEGRSALPLEAHRASGCASSTTPACPPAPLQFTEELLEDPQVLENGFITEHRPPAAWARSAWPAP